MMVTQLLLPVCQADCCCSSSNLPEADINPSAFTYHTSCSNCEWCAMYESKSNPAPAHSPLKEPYTSVLSSSGLPQF
jgi:hypothetical protein